METGNRIWERPAGAFDMKSGVAAQAKVRCLKRTYFPSTNSLLSLDPIVGDRDRAVKEIYSYLHKLRRSSISLPAALRDLQSSSPNPKRGSTSKALWAGRGLSFAVARDLIVKPTRALDHTSSR